MAADGKPVSAEPQLHLDFSLDALRMEEDMECLDLSLIISSQCSSHAEPVHEVGASALE